MPTQMRFKTQTSLIFTNTFIKKLWKSRFSCLTFPFSTHVRDFMSFTRWFNCVIDTRRSVLTVFKTTFDWSRLAIYNNRAAYSKNSANQAFKKILVLQIGITDNYFIQLLEWTCKNIWNIWTIRAHWNQT